jgi:WD40 repeat protein
VTEATPGTGVRDTGTVDRDNPWPGLAAFRETDREFFYGREAATESLFELVTRERVAILYGASGLGKTSLIQAGLFPKGRLTDLLPVRIRLRFAENGVELGEQIAAALVHEANERRIEAPARQAGETLWEFFYRKDALWWSERHRILTPLLVLDQFEEIFTIGRRTVAMAAASQAFVQELKGLIFGLPPAPVKERCDANPDEALRFSLSRCPVRVLFSFREDYLAEFLELREMLPTVGENDYRLLRMSCADAERVILGAGRTLVTPAVASHIVQIIAGARARFRSEDLTVDPALLSVFCRELNNERRNLGQPQITDELLKDNQTTILENFYYRSLEGLDPRVQVFIEDELLLPDSPERNSVAEQIALRRPGVTADAIERLIDRRLLRRDERDGPARLELSHDVLVEPVQRSRDLRVLRETEEKRLAELHEAEEKEKQALAESREKERQEFTLRVAEADARRAKADADVARAQAELADRRAAFAVIARRRSRTFLSVTTVLLAAAVVFAFAAWRSRKEAERGLAAAVIQVSSRLDAERRNDIALAYLAYAVRKDRDNKFARGKLIDSLLHRTWPLPAAILHHQGAVVSASFSADGLHLLTADDQGGVGIWPVAGSPKDPEQRVLNSPALLARYDPSGRFVAAVRSDGGADLFDIREARADQGANDGHWTLRRGSAPIMSAAFSSDGELVATGSDDGTVRIARTSDPSTPVTEFGGHSGRITSLQFTRDGTRLLTSSADTTARLWDVATGTERETFAGHRSAVVFAQFSPDETRVLTASTDGTARLWPVPEVSVPTRPRLPRIPAKTAPVAASQTFTHNGPVWSARFSADGNRVLTASEDGTARVWSVLAGAPLAPAMSHTGAVLGASFSKDGSRVVTASRDNSARVWDAESATPITEPMWHDSAVVSATFSPDGDRVVTASDDGTAVVWDVRPGAATPNTITVGRIAYSVQFSADGKSVLIGSKDGTARIWDTVADKLAHTLPYEAGASWPEYSRDGNMILAVENAQDGAAGAMDNPLLQTGTARLWSTETWKPVGWPPMAHQGKILTARLSPDAQRVVTISLNQAPGKDTPRHELLLWDVHTGALLQTLKLSADDTDVPLAWADFSQDSQSVVAAVGRPDGQSGLAAVWNLKTGESTTAQKFESPAAPMYFASLSPGSDWLLAFGKSNTALLWALKPGNSPPVRLRHDGTVLFARFNPAGDRIVTTSEDTTAKIWKHPTGTSAPSDLRHGQAVEWADFSSDGERVVTTARDGTARLWDASSGDAATVPLVHPTAVFVLMARFSPDSERVATAADDGRVSLWHVPYGTKEDAMALAELAEAVSGYVVKTDGTVERVDRVGRLQSERDDVARQPADSPLLSTRLGKWFLADRAKRTTSPFSTRTADVSRDRDDLERK